MSTMPRSVTSAPTRPAIVRAAYEATRGKHRPTAHPQDDARIAEGALESHRPVEPGSLEFAADPGDSDGMVEARADSRKGHQDEEGPETGRQVDEERAEAEDCDSDREKAR